MTLVQHPHPAESGSQLLIGVGGLVATPAMRGTDIGTSPARRAGGVPGPWARIVRFVLPGATLLLIAVEAPAVAPYVGRAAHSLGKADPRWLLVAVVAELWSMVLFARLQRRMLSAGGTRVPLHTMVGLSYAANAMSRTLPAGSAVSSTYAFHRLRGFGASVPLAGFTLAASGVLSTAAFTLLGLTAGVATGAGSLSPVTWTAGIVTAVLAVYLARHVTAGSTFPQRALGLVLGWSDRVRRRPAGSGRAAAHDLTRALGEIKPRRRDWGAGLTTASANWLTDAVCLAASFRAVAVHVSTPLLIAAFLAGATASSLSIMPGGMGVVDAAMILTLTHGGLPVAAATASVVLYRLISFVLIVALGWIAWTAHWRRGRPMGAWSPTRRLCHARA